MPFLNEQALPAPAQEQDRGRKIVRTSMIGIGANLLLAALKAAVGLLASSIAIVMDAVNNLSDAASSVITIIGTRLAARAPDRKHPFGHGRVEYLSAMIIAVIVLYAGITSLVESVKKIIAPETPDYSAVTLIIVGAAVIVKIVLGRYVKAKGKQLHSDALVNSGQDAMLDAVISASTLAAAIIFLISGVSLEAWLAAVISLLIIKSGIQMLRETLSKLLGERADVELARSVKETVLSFPQVQGVYDLVLNDYGPDRINGSLHIEIPDTISADDLDEMLRQITEKVYSEQKVILTAVGVYAVNTRDAQVVAMREKIHELVFAHEHILQMHGFHVNRAAKTIRFDLIISFDAQDRKAVYDHVLQDVKEIYPDYQVQITMDTDFSET